MTGRHLVIVGASLAGLRAVEGARRAGHDGPVTLVGAEPHLPYDRPPLSKQLLAPDGDPGTALRPYRDEAALAELGVTLRLGSPATGVDLAARTVRVGDDDAPYDDLVVATGAHARTLDLEGADAPGVVVLRTRDDAVAVRSALDEGERVVVVGAGFVGLEVASAVRARGAEVVVLEASPRPLARSVGPEAAELLVALTRDSGVDLRTGVTVSGFATRGGRVSGVQLDDGTVVDAGLVVVGVGAAPATGWLEGSGLALDDGVVVDPTLRTSDPRVWAAGDVARVRDADGTRRVEHWTNAHEQGLLVGANVVAAAREEPLRDHVTVPYVWSDVHDAKVQLLGTARDADRTEVLGAADGPWLVLYGRGDALTGVLGRDVAGRVMKFRPLLVRGAGFDEALEQARSKPLPTR
ncbi:NAD(P)/FAD-dependent oxidoreductase [Nocardioides marmoraquaticus]